MTEPMMDIDAIYATDAQAEEEGTWVEYQGGVEIKTRSDQSTVVRKEVRKLFREYRKYMDKAGVLPIDKEDEFNAKKAAVLAADWRGVSRGGVPLPCTRQNVYDVMAKHHKLRGEVLMAGALDETFKPEDVEAAGEDSPPVSAPVTTESSDTAAQPK